MLPNAFVRAGTVVQWTLVACVWLTGACATKPPANRPEELAEYNETNDPLEPTNRKFYAVNNALDKNLMHPAASAYRDVTTPTLRMHVHNVLSNLGDPAQFANDVLQGKPRKATDSFMRLLINTTVGIGGIFDAAKGMGFPDHDNDFGLTLALWSVPSGPFLFLPVLGPTNPRDAVGYGMNTVLDPLTWVSFGGSTTLGWTRTVAAAVVTRERLMDETDAVDKTSLDPYAAFRSLAQQHREAEIAAAKPDKPGQPAPDKRNQVPDPQLAPSSKVEP